MDEYKLIAATRESDPKERERILKFNEEALYRPLWRTRFGRGYGPVVRKITSLLLLLLLLLSSSSSWTCYVTGVEESRSLFCLTTTNCHLRYVVYLITIAHSPDKPHAVQDRRGVTPRQSPDKMTMQHHKIADIMK
jgi:hypothetical protein